MSRDDLGPRIGNSRLPHEPKNMHPVACFASLVSRLVVAQNSLGSMLVSRAMFSIIRDTPSHTPGTIFRSRRVTKIARLASRLGSVAASSPCDPNSRFSSPESCPRFSRVHLLLLPASAIARRMVLTHPPHAPRRKSLAALHLPAPHHAQAPALFRAHPPRLPPRHHLTINAKLS